MDKKKGKAEQRDRKRTEKHSNIKYYHLINDFRRNRFDCSQSWKNDDANVINSQGLHTY